MLRTLIAVAASSALAKKAWDRYQAGKRRPPEDITELVGRPEAARPQGKRRATVKRRRTEGPGA